MISKVEIISRVESRKATCLATNDSGLHPHTNNEKTDVLWPRAQHRCSLGLSALKLLMVFHTTVKLVNLFRPLNPLLEHLREGFVD